MNGSRQSPVIAICFGQFGPYHHARVAALQRFAREVRLHQGFGGSDGLRVAGGGFEVTDGGDPALVGQAAAATKGEPKTRVERKRKAEFLNTLPLLNTEHSTCSGSESLPIRLPFTQASNSSFSPSPGSSLVCLRAISADSGSRHSSLPTPSVRVIPVQIAAGTTTYEWKDGGGKRCEDLHTLCEGVEEEASAVTVFFRARRIFKREGVEVVFVPSYSPARYLALFLAAKSLGCRTVMMNESHAGTERATGWRRWVKRQIVRRFDAALVGGAPHKCHFASLGIPEEKIFTGYDAVDNDFFASRAREVKKWEIEDGI